MSGFTPFPRDRAAAYRAAGYWSGRPVDSLLTDAARNWPTRIAVIDPAERLSFAELDLRADRFAAGLRAMEVLTGERVLLQLPNRCTFAVALFGILRAGAIPVLCLPGHRVAEMRHLAAVSDAVALVIADATVGFDYPALSAEVQRAAPALRHVIIDGQAGAAMSFASLCATVAECPPRPVADPNVPALLLVSGGTTGAPKLIPRTHDDYVYNATASAAVCGLTGADVYLVALPAAHNFPLACPGLLGCVSVGATTVFTTDPSPESAFAAIAEHKVTVTALVPALATIWAAACEWEPQTPKTLRLLQVGGGKLGSADAATVRAALTAGLQQVFGMAEGLLCYTRPGDPPEIVEHTQGRPLSPSDEIRIVDDDSTDVTLGAEGELLVRGPYTINGYYNAPEVNARAFTADGFYRSGDRVRWCDFADLGAYLEVTGRIKDVIDRGGESVASEALEEPLSEHPAVSAVAVLGLPDQYLGEKICAAVVFSGEPVNMAELNRYLTERGTAIHARIDALAVLPALPVTAVGKIDKKAVARQLASTDPVSNRFASGGFDRL